VKNKNKKNIRNPEQETAGRHFRPRLAEIPGLHQTRDRGIPTTTHHKRTHSWSITLARPQLVGTASRSGGSGAARNPMEAPKKRTSLLSGRPAGEDQRCELAGGHHRPEMDGQGDDIKDDMWKQIQVKDPDQRWKQTRQSQPLDEKHREPRVRFWCPQTWKQPNNTSYRCLEFCGGNQTVIECFNGRWYPKSYGLRKILPAMYREAAAVWYRG